MTVVTPSPGRRALAELAELYRGMQTSYAAVTSLDPYGLLDRETPELKRYVITLAELERRVRGAGDRPRLCDLGGYVGLFGAAAAAFGYDVDVVDSYERDLDAPAQQGIRDWWDEHRISAHNIDLQQPDLRLPFEDATFDVVTLLAVIEHFPHTPRLVLEEARRVLRPDGVLFVDTPNAGALGSRIGFLRHGEGLWASVEDVYWSEIPFAGHKRCYSRRELVQILQWAGFGSFEVRVFDLAPARHSGSRGARLLYDRAYPWLQRVVPDLRGYLWVAATPARAAGT